MGNGVGLRRWDLRLKPEEVNGISEGSASRGPAGAGTGRQNLWSLWDTSEPRGPIHTLLRQRSVTGLGELPELRAFLVASRAQSWQSRVHGAC